MTSRQASVDRRRTRPRRRTASTPGLLALGHDVEHAAAGVGAGVADDHGAGHVGAVAVDEPPKSITTRSPSTMRAVAGPVVGLGAVRARRDDRLEAELPLGAAPAHLEVELEPELLLGGPVGRRWQHVGEGVVGDARQAASMRATSPSSFTRRRSSTRPVGRHELGAGEPVGREACAAGPR